MLRLFLFFVSCALMLTSLKSSESELTEVSFTRPIEAGSSSGSLEYSKFNSFDEVFFPAFVLRDFGLARSSFDDLFSGGYVAFKRNLLALAMKKEQPKSVVIKLRDHIGFFKLFFGYHDDGKPLKSENLLRFEIDFSRTLSLKIYPNSCKYYLYVPKSKKFPDLPVVDFIETEEGLVIRYDVVCEGLNNKVIEFYYE